MTDMSRVIEVDSTQLNADDLASGAQTFTISAVKIRGGKEQPVEISLKETDKFYRPCKSMCRCFVAAWGPDSSKYIGRSITLYCDPKIRWGGLEVGGLRISHMSHLDSQLTMALTVSRGSKKPYTVKPLVAEASYSDQIRDADSLDALGKVWMSIPRSEQKNYLAAKDARKAELSAPVDPVTPDPGNPVEPAEL